MVLQGCAYLSFGDDFKVECNDLVEGVYKVVGQREELLLILSPGGPGKKGAEKSKTLSHIENTLMHLLIINPYAAC